MNVYTELWGNARSAAGGRESEGISRTTPKRCQWQKKRGVVEEAAGELRAKASKATNAATVSRSAPIGATDRERESAWRDGVQKRGVVEEAAGELRAKASKATNAATVGDQTGG